MTETREFRILAHDEDGEIYFMVHEVLFEDGFPVRYVMSGAAASGRTRESLELSASQIFATGWIEQAKPILWAGERFPKVYNENHKPTSVKPVAVPVKKTWMEKFGNI